MNVAEDICSKRFLLAPIRMTLNDLEYYSALYGRHAWRTTCCCFRSWPCVTKWTWALAVSAKNVASEL